MLKTNFYTTPNIKKWDEEKLLTFDDFKGIPPPFTGFGAGIHSQVYLDYDTSNVKYFAYAGQNNMRSWKRVLDSVGLIHEQYHFNISEYHARKMNEFIDQNPDASLKRLNGRLSITLKELDRMQEEYDNETNHSLNWDQQNLWQFRIDTLLNSYDSVDNSYEDQLADVQFKSFGEPDFGTQATQNGSFRSYFDMKYEMIFSLVIIQNFGTSKDDFKKGIEKLANDDSVFISHFEESKDVWNYHLLYHDSLNRRTTSDRWIATGFNNNFYRVRIESPLSSSGDGFYMLRKYLNENVVVKDYDSYWKKSFEEKERRFDSKLVNKDTEARHEDGMKCFKFSKSGHHLFFREPFKDKNGNLILVFDPISHQNEDILSNVMLFGGKMISGKKESLYQFLIIPSQELSSNDFHLSFGYLAKSDSTDRCDMFYNESYYLKLN